MTIVPEYRRCKNCGKKFSFNPDVGNFICPYCGSILGKKHLSGLPKLGIKKSSKKDNTDNDN